MNHRQQWTEEMQRSVATLAAIKQCVAPSPRQEAWLASTARAIVLMSEHVAGVTQAKGEAARLVAECRDGESR